MQPPSGGCVLKLLQVSIITMMLRAATFGWLCVETVANIIWTAHMQAATFGWLCVETFHTNDHNFTIYNSSHLRVAVCWNIGTEIKRIKKKSSHLRVAVCWNYSLGTWYSHTDEQPPSGGCVLKHAWNAWLRLRNKQPPSGGCVLKLCVRIKTMKKLLAATFGWLCVETSRFLMP